MAIIVGVDESVKKRVTCRNCAHIIEYVPKDIRTLWEGRDMGGGPDGAKGFSCPNCSEDIITERW